MNSVEEFYNDFMQQIYTSSDVGEDYRESQFFEKSMEYLLEEGVVGEYTSSYYKKKNIGLKINGYGYIEDREILNIFICDFHDDYTLKPLIQSEIEANVRRVIKFITHSISNELYKKIEPTSTGYPVAYFLHNNQNRFKTINITLIRNKLLSDRVKSIRAK